MPSLEPEGASPERKCPGNEVAQGMGWLVSEKRAVLGPSVH